MARYGQKEVGELVSHVFALRKDFITHLLRSSDIAYSGLRKRELRDRVEQAIGDGRLRVEDVVAFLDAVEPGGKQHVFLSRPPAKLNKEWKDPKDVRQRLARRKETKALLSGSVPLLMPPELELSAIRVDDGFVEIVGVEARRYSERDESYDDYGETEDGLPIELRAFVERVARSVVALRWNTRTRHAGLHITQASGRGLDRDHYRQVARRFAEMVKPWLDFDAFEDVNLHKVIHALGGREATDGDGALTRSRRGQWDTTGGSELTATSPSPDDSVYADRRIATAISAVADPASGQAGNMYWLPQGDGHPLSEPLHVSMIASDSRVHFMVPSSTAGVEYVLGQIRRLL